MFVKEPLHWVYSQMFSSYLSREVKFFLDVATVCAQLVTLIISLANTFLSGESFLVTPNIGVWCSRSVVWSLEHPI